MLECSQCNCLVEPIDLDGGYYIEESLHPRRSSLHTLICLGTKDNTIKQGYMRVNKGVVLEIYGGAYRLRECGRVACMAHTHSILVWLARPLLCSIQHLRWPAPVSLVAPALSLLAHSKFKALERKTARRNGECLRAWWGV